MGNHDWRAHLRYMMKIFEMSQLGYTEEEFVSKKFSDLENEFSNAFKTKGLSYQKLLIQSSEENGFEEQNYQMILSDKGNQKATMKSVAEFLEM